MKLSNKTIVVTGGGSGIGQQLVLELLRRGAKVAATDISEDNLSETYSLIPDSFKGNFSKHIFNIADKDAAEALPNEVIEQHGAVDGIINNAGIIQPFVKINDLTYDQIERVMQINFYGSLFMIKSFLPHLLKRPTAHITNVSSMGGFLPVPGQSIYGAAKAAIKLMSEGLYAELKDSNVNVSVVFPGAIATNIVTNSGLDMQAISQENGNHKTLPADKAAQIILDGMERNKVRIYVGKDSKMMNLLYRLAPGFATNLIAKQMKSLLQ
jgi:short-subunit dehydrogenase